MSIRNLIESAIKGDALSFNEEFSGIMNEAAVVAVEDFKDPEADLGEVVEVLIGLGVLTVEEVEAGEITEEDLLELSKKTLGSYIASASSDKSHHAHRIGVVNGIAKTTGTSEDDREERDHHNDKHKKRDRGIQNAVKKLTKEETEEELLELSKKTLKSYKNKAIKDKEDHEYNRDSSSNPAVKKHFNDQVQKRSAGLKNAKKRLGNISKFEETEVETIDEVSRETLVNYKRKANKEIQDPKTGNNKRHNRAVGYDRAEHKLNNGKHEETEVEAPQLDELSSKVLGSYVRKASNQVYHAATMGRGGEQKDMVKVANKRLDGVQKAADRIQNKKD